MIYRFPYNDVGPLDIAPSHPVQIYAPREVPDVPAAGEVIARALAAPVGMSGLADGLSPRSRVLMLVDDVSRPTPAHLVVPQVLHVLKTAGVPDNNIRFLIALGTHRPMTPHEIARKIGPAAARFEVLNHQWDNPSELRSYGRLDDGAEVVLSRHLGEADFVLGIGGVAPHPAAGFSGGGKIVAPGVATEQAVGEFHWASVQFPQRDVLGVRDNPMRRQIDAIAALGGLRAIVNLVQDGSGKVAYAVAGEPVAAHRRACELAMEVYGVRVQAPGPGGILIADTHPLDQDLWQGVKAMCALDAIAADGCAVVLVAPAPEGVAPMHPGISRYGYCTLSEARELLAAGKVDKVTAHNMVQGGRLVRRTRAFLVSGGVSDAEARRLGFEPCRTPQEALGAAEAIKGTAAPVTILRMGGEICPVAR
jgi:nickel-dependent lactate racemase